MAIIKIVEAPNGATGEYTRISKVDFFSDDQSLVISTDIYATEEAMLEGKNILWQERTIVPWTALTQDPRNVFYKILDEYSYSPFRGGESDEDGEPAADMTIQLTEAAKEEIDFGAVIPPYNPGTGAEEQLPIWNKFEILADGVDEAVLTGIPSPTKFEFLNLPPSAGRPLPVEEYSGEFGFNTTVPGKYTIRASAIGYIDYIATIIAS